jgi:cell division protease FtsH
MVCEWGMSDNLGPLSLGKKEEQIFLGREFAQHRDYSEDTARSIDSEIRAIVIHGHERAKEIIQTNMAILHKLANTLLEKEVLDGHQIDAIIKGGAVV